MRRKCRGGSPKQVQKCRGGGVSTKMVGRQKNLKSRGGGVMRRKYRGEGCHRNWCENVGGSLKRVGRQKNLGGVHRYRCENVGGVTEKGRKTKKSRGGVMRRKCRGGHEAKM